MRISELGALGLLGLSAASSHAASAQLSAEAIRLDLAAIQEPADLVPIAAARVEGKFNEFSNSLEADPPNDSIVKQFRAPGVTESKYSIIYVNGVLTDFNTFAATSTLISRMFNASVLGIHNTSHGLLDFGSAATQVINPLKGLTTEEDTVRALVHVLQQRLSDPSTENEPILLLGHSQGGLIEADALSRCHKQHYSEMTIEEFGGLFERHFKILTLGSPITGMDAYGHHNKFKADVVPYAAHLAPYVKLLVPYLRYVPNPEYGFEGNHVGLPLCTETEAKRYIDMHTNELKNLPTLDCERLSIEAHNVERYVRTIPAFEAERLLRLGENEGILKLQEGIKALENRYASTRRIIELTRAEFEKFPELKVKGSNVKIDPKEIWIETLPSTIDGVPREILPEMSPPGYGVMASRSKATQVSNLLGWHQGLSEQVADLQAQLAGLTSQNSALAGAFGEAIKVNNSLIKRIEERLNELETGTLIEFQKSALALIGQGVRQVGDPKLLEDFKLLHNQVQAAETPEVANNLVADFASRVDQLAVDRVEFAKNAELFKEWGNVAAQLIALKDPKAGQVVSHSVNAIFYAAMAAENPILWAGFASSVISLGSSLFGDDGPDNTALILEAIAKLHEAVFELHKTVIDVSNGLNLRIDHVDAQLDTVIESLEILHGSLDSFRAEFTGFRAEVRRYLENIGLNTEITRQGIDLLLFGPLMQSRSELSNHKQRALNYLILEDIPYDKVREELIAILNHGLILSDDPDKNGLGNAVNQNADLFMRGLVDYAGDDGVAGLVGVIAGGFRYHQQTGVSPVVNALMVQQSLLAAEEIVAKLSENKVPISQDVQALLTLLHQKRAALFEQSRQFGQAFRNMSNRLSAVQNFSSELDSLLEGGRKDAVENKDIRALVGVTNRVNLSRAGDMLDAVQSGISLNGEMKPAIERMTALRSGTGLPSISTGRFVPSLWAGVSAPISLQLWDGAFDINPMARVITSMRSTAEQRSSTGSILGRINVQLNGNLGYSSKNSQYAAELRAAGFTSPIILGLDYVPEDWKNEGKTWLVGTGKYRREYSGGGFDGAHDSIRVEIKHTYRKVSQTSKVYSEPHYVFNLTSNNNQIASLRIIGSKPLYAYHQKEFQTKNKTTGKIVSGEGYTEVTHEKGFPSQAEAFFNAKTRPDAELALLMVSHFLQNTDDHRYKDKIPSRILIASGYSVGRKTYRNIAKVEVLFLGEKRALRLPGTLIEAMNNALWQQGVRDRRENGETRNIGFSILDIRFNNQLPKDFKHAFWAPYREAHQIWRDKAGHAVLETLGTEGSSLHTASLKLDSERVMLEVLLRQAMPESFAILDADGNSSIYIPRLHIKIPSAVELRQMIEMLIRSGKGIEGVQQYLHSLIDDQKQATKQLFEAWERYCELSNSN